MTCFGSQSKTKSNKSEVLYITKMFSENIRFDSEERITRKNRNDVMNIYKNFLSDIKIYYNEQYIKFLNELQLDPNNSLIQLPLFPVIMREFLTREFDVSIINLFRPLNEIN